MKAYKVCISETVGDGIIEDHSAIFTDKLSAFKFACEFDTYHDFDVRIFPVSIKVKYPWNREYDDK